MCGIVGYVGKKPAQEFLHSGLKRLEYRGYDSAGIVTIGDDGQATKLRAVGKVKALGDLVASNRKTDMVGIGHTRWATHGKPSEVNAHPHQAGDIYVVHNGIIENYKELKQNLSGHEFVSETDTEVLAALINELYQRPDIKLENAVTQALKLVHGTYGIAVVSVREPEKVIVARMGSPLIVGIDDDASYIASDASALVGHTDKAVYLNDGELAIIQAGQVDVQDLSSQPISVTVETIETNIQAVQKQGYEHFLLKEIMEQPSSVRATISGRVIADEHRAQLGGLNLTTEELRSVEHVVIIGCGTAAYAGQLAAYYIERLVDNVTVEVQIASEYRYRSFHLPKNSLALAVSQSGETADTLACLREIKRRGVKVLGVVNAVGSTIAREVDGGVYVHAGPEISVASTKAFTSQVTAMTIFALQLAQAKGVGLQEIDSYIEELERLPDEIQAVLDAKHDEMKEVASKYAKYDHALYLGRDTLYPAALEGSLKLKECSYVHSEAVPLGELKHGTIALIDDRFFEVILAQDNWLFEKTASGIAEVNARSGHVLVITDSDKEFEAETVVRISTKLDLLVPLVINVAQQLLAYYIAVAKGNDVDQPRNLAKSVTVE